MLIQLFLYKEGGHVVIGEVPMKQISVPDNFTEVFFKNKMLGEHTEMASLINMDKTVTVMKVLLLHPMDENVNYIKKKNIEGMLYLTKSTNNLIPVTERRDNQTNLIWKNKTYQKKEETS